MAAAHDARPWLLTALLLALAGCGGGGGKVSSKSLEPRLLPASVVPGFAVGRRLDWSNPIDLVGEGVALSGMTHPSAAVKAFESADLKGAAGEVLVRGVGLNTSEIHIGVAKLGSASDAVKMRSWMHIEDLQQPCFTACVFRPHPVKLSRLPGSAAVVQTTTGRKSGSGLANYRAEFTIGPYLYWVWFQGDATAKSQSRFESGLSRYYEHAKPSR